MDVMVHRAHKCHTVHKWGNVTMLKARTREGHAALHSARETLVGSKHLVQLVKSLDETRSAGRGF